MGDRKLGKVLKEERKKLKFTQKQVADKAGVNANWYARFERGEENASQDTRDTILKILKIKISYNVD